MEQRALYGSALRGAATVAACVSLMNLERNMAQLSEGLIREFQRAIDEHRHPPITIGEAQQLCLAWLKLNSLPVEQPVKP